ncbi:hypothetical protein AVEN_190084-1 [Araneus ventricosus]|uniref:Pre-C2HC domain-containing protein n=1 Tax=Araneus ventricosus TaxID=182803 RepID=A0A4Y2V527_ARAVE|nr:hypothetical protein AVEN_190084-1 [Araneus ventricosus]
MDARSKDGSGAPVPETDNSDPDYKEFLRLQDLIVRALRSIDEKWFTPGLMTYGIQQTRQYMGKWHNLILHHPEYNNDKCVKIVTKYNQVLRDNGCDSEYEGYDGESTVSDISFTESILSEKDVFELNDKEMSENHSSIRSSTPNIVTNINGVSSATNIDKSNTAVPCMPSAADNNGTITQNVSKNVSNSVANNYVAHKMRGEEITALEAVDKTMDVDVPNDYPIVNGNNSNGKNLETNGEFQFQNRKRGRASPQKDANNKKTNSDSIPLQNKFSPLAKLPTAESTQEQANNVNQGKTPKITPITLKKPANYRELLRSINEVEKIKCIAKEAGEFLKLHCTTPDDAKKLTDYFDKNQNEYFVIPHKTSKPIKVVIKGLPKETDMEDIKEELINKNFRVEKVNQLKKFKTREPLNIGECSERMDGLDVANLFTSGIAKPPPYC